MVDLFSHMNAGINALILDALKVAVRKPKQLQFLRSFWKNLGAAEARRAANEQTGLHVPPFLIASITSNCNLFCAGCYARANQGCPSGAAGSPLSAERWRELFAEAGKLGVCFILLAGGEPLLRADVLAVAAQYPQIIFPVFTNGTLFGDDAIALFDQHRNMIPVISLEGEKRETDKRRGEGVFDKTVEAMAALKKNKVLFGVSVTVTRANVTDVTSASFMKSLKDRGCGLVFYVEYVPSDTVSQDIAPTEAEREILEAAVNRLKQSSRMLVISFPGDEKETGGCLAAGRGFVHINMDGSVEPCPFSPYSDTNLIDITLRQALQSPFLTRMREDGFLLGEHAGGCLLFEKQEEVRAMLKELRS